MSRSTSRGAYLCVVGLALLIGFAFQGSRNIYEPDEGFYVSVAKDMALSGRYLVPYLNHEPFLDKPPLTYWGIALGMKIFGINEFGARAFHGLTFVLTVLIVIEIGTAMWDRVHGLRAGAIYSTMILPVASESVVTVDATLAMCAAAAFYCFWRSVDTRTERLNFWKMAMCLCFGLGFVAKGPAILILSAPMFAFLAIRRRVISYFVTPWAPLWDSSYFVSWAFHGTPSLQTEFPALSNTSGTIRSREGW